MSKDSLVKLNDALGYGFSQKNIAELTEELPAEILDGVAPYLKQISGYNRATTKLYLPFNIIKKTRTDFVLHFLKNKRKKLSFPPTQNYAGLKFRVEFEKHASRVVSLKKNKPSILVTHDVDSLDSFKKIRQVLEIEKSLGVTSVWYVVGEIQKQFLEKYPELEKHTFLHGVNHSGTLLANLKEFEKQVPRYAINQGFRAPWLHHSPALFDVLEKTGFKHDSSIPTFEEITPFISPGGCGDLISFKPILQNGKIASFTEHPVTLTQDYAFYNRYACTPTQITEYYTSMADFIVENNGLVTLLTHPDEKDSGSKDGLKVYEDTLEHFVDNYSKLLRVIDKSGALV